MGKYRYYYNSETCQYERVRLTLWKVVGYSAGVIAVGGLLFAGLIVLSDRITKTELEKSLISENKALREHQKTLSSQLQEIEANLTRLREKDRLIHVTLFEKNAADHREVPDRKPIILAEASVFNLSLHHLISSSEKLLDYSKIVNANIERGFKLKKEEVDAVQATPTLQPITHRDPELIVSGFGMRINPFHKGEYFHPGIDFTAPRGTPVVATAPGKVILVSKSDLQAGYGNYLDIDHGNGFITRYAHLEEILTVRGQKVTKGEVIGSVGNSGGSVAPHLHYEVILNGKNVDPIIYMVEGLSSDTYNDLLMMSKTQNQSLD